MPIRYYPIEFSGDAWIETVQRLCDAGYQATLNGVDVKLVDVDAESNLVGLLVDADGDPLVPAQELRVPTVSDLTLRIH